MKKIRKNPGFLKIEIFVVILSVELYGVHARKWNAERVIVFQSVIIQCAKGVNSSAHIRKCILFWIDCWNCGAFDELVKDTYNSNMGYLGKSRGIKRRSNVIERSQTLLWKGNCVKPSDSSVTEKRGDFCNQMNWMMIIQAWSTRLSHRFWRENILAKQFPPVIY